MSSHYQATSSAMHAPQDARRSTSRRSEGQHPYYQQPHVEAQGRRSQEDGRHHRPRTNVQQYRGEKRHHPHRKLSTLQGHLVAMSGEFVGTIMFLWFALAGTQSAATLSGNDQDGIPRVFYVATSFGLSLLVCAWVFYRISGGLFNPAVTIGLVTAGQMTVMRGLFILPAQIIGGIVAAALVSAMFPNSIALTSTTLSPGVSITRGVFIEAFLTFILVFSILMLAAEQNMARPVAPVCIGLALFIAELAGVPYTGGSLNPARSFGPCVVIPSFPGYHYIYWFGPIMGALVAALYYRFVKLMNYHEAQPGQDHPFGEDDIERTRSQRSGQY